MHLAGVAAALADHPGQCLFNAAKLGDALAHQGQLRGAQPLGFPAVAPVLQHEQIGNFAQT